MRLPLEICELIIDLTADEPPLWTTREEYETFKNCALVCRAWVSRSQWNLFYSTHLDKASQVNQLISLFSANPSLADLVQYVHVGHFLLQTTGYGDTFSKDGYIPFATGQLTRALQNARVLRLTGLTWPSYPPVYKSLLRQFKSLVELQLNSITFGSAGDVIRMAWNCPALHTLVLEYIRITQPASEAECARLQGSRRPQACNQLRRVVLEDVRRIHGFDLWGVECLTSERPTVARFRGNASSICARRRGYVTAAKLQHDAAVAIRR